MTYLALCAEIIHSNGQYCKVLVLEMKLRRAKFMSHKPYNQISFAVQLLIEYKAHLNYMN